MPLPAVVITWPAPAASSADAPALKVLDAILSSGKSSRLFNSLAMRIAVEIFSDADLREQPGSSDVGALMSEGESVDKGEAALRDSGRAALRDRPVTRAELDEAKNELIASAVRERETVEGRADALGFALTCRETPPRPIRTSPSYRRLPWLTSSAWPRPTCGPTSAA